MVLDCYLLLERWNGASSFTVCCRSAFDNCIGHVTGLHSHRHQTSVEKREGSLRIIQTCSSHRFKSTCMSNSTHRVTCGTCGVRFCHLTPSQPQNNRSQSQHTSRCTFVLKVFLMPKFNWTLSVTCSIDHSILSMTRSQNQSWFPR